MIAHLAALNPRASRVAGHVRRSPAGPQKKFATVSIPVSLVRRPIEAERKGDPIMQSTTSSKKTNALLWTLQALLALLVLFAGGSKLVLPIAALTAQSPLPGSFIRFIGVAEVLGALGLILPGILRIQRGLTPLAACGLAVIMMGATALTAPAGPAALFPFAVGLACAFVAYGRRPSALPASTERAAEAP
jgi:hypothetical protein